MGLSAPKKRIKLSQDPNNTTWSHSTTDRFGHRILSSFGWSPGSILGADPSSPLHSAASTSHIRVVLKDDNLGIGCSKQAAADECTGLGDLQSLLGRLNGKSEEAVKSEEEVRRKVWVEGKYGMRFVKGGVYVSSDVSELVERMKIGGVGGVGKVEEVVIKKEEEEVILDEVDNENKSRKKKRKYEEEAGEENDAEERRQRRQEKRERKEQKAKDKKERKEQRRALKLASSTAATTITTTKTTETSSSITIKSSEKENKKEKKRSKKDRKQELPSSESTSSSSESESEATSTTVSTLVSTPVSTPYSNSGTSTPVFATGRHALRSKWIAQKRMAVMDAKALNEILMIKA